MAVSAPARTPYSSDLMDAQWQLLEPLIPAAKRGGRPARHSRREVVNAILYVARNGGAWRNLPHDLPPWSLVYYYFWHWQNDGTGRAPTKPCAPGRTFSWLGKWRRLSKDYE